MVALLKQKRVLYLAMGQSHLLRKAIASMRQRFLE
jgi:hypothetical protein